MEQNNMFTEDCSKAIHEAYNYAKKQSHEFITIDTVMLFISQTTKGKALFEAMGLNLANYISTTIEYLDENIPRSVNGDNP